MIQRRDRYRFLVVSGIFTGVGHYPFGCTGGLGRYRTFIPAVVAGFTVGRTFGCGCIDIVAGLVFLDESVYA